MISLNLLDELVNLDSTKTTPLELTEHLDLLEKAHANLHSVLIQARMRKLMNEFGQRDTDIYVVAYPRSGTTLMQMVLYQMTTDGSMEFSHIYDVSPWCRYSAFVNKRMPSVGERRIIKSHENYSWFKEVEKGKVVFVVRNCLDVISSVYQQTRDYVDPSVEFDQLARRNFKRWLEYNQEWVENRNGLRIFFVNYEDLVERKREVIENLSQFLKIGTDDDMVSRTIERSSFSFMKAHESKFGEQPDDWKVFNNFIRRGEVGKGKESFTAEQLDEFYHLAQKYNVGGTCMERYFDKR